jgi:hypothetical protein
MGGEYIDADAPLLHIIGHVSRGSQRRYWRNLATVLASLRNSSAPARREWRQNRPLAHRFSPIGQETLQPDVR